MAREYPDEVWNRLREVFETSPKLTWQSLVDQVGAELDCEMPSPSVVRRKAIKEKWKKRSKSLVKKTAHDLNQEIKKLTSDYTGQSSDQDNENKDNSSSQKDVKNSSNLTTFSGQNQRSHNANSQVKKNKLTAALVIKNNRDRLATLGGLAGDTIDSVIHIRDEILKIDIENLADNPNAEQIINGLKFKMSLICQVVDLNLKQSITLSNVARSEAQYWGLEMDELKDQSEQQARRTSTIIDAEEKLAKAKAAMKEQKRLAFERKLEIIESGEYEYTLDDEEVTEHE